MKIRYGFVSNSSTTSFCIYGATIDEKRIDEKSLKEYNLELNYGDPNGDGDVYVGISWSDIKDDETGAQFKNRVQDVIRKLFGDDIKCRTISEAYYDG